ncbi:hypothetical protein DPMN_179882 [Dreissena polymorpha]|uniref:Uncharacterized protein n=1 Tax=Dreissena polymorpha TaxID=45954 RepID=A0A9D4EFW7_DREPO|nr:hypothetical protein DPMN_179882 [Dreissena polymorpha]
MIGQKLNTAPPLGGHVFQWTGTILKLNQHIIKTNILTKLHEDWASNMTSTVFASFELSQGINKANVLTKFHEDQTINVASRVLTRQNVDDARRTTDKRRAQKLTLSTMCSDIIGTNLLTMFHEDPTINVAAKVFTRQIFMTHNGRQTIDKR